MIKTTYICDFCGKEVDPTKEDFKRMSIRNLGEAAIDENDICQDCVDKIFDMLKGGKG